MDKRRTAATPLFRTEALEHRHGSWLGEVVIARPVSFTLATLAAVAITASTCAYLVWGEYTKKARVSGYIVPDKGLLKVVAFQQGVVSTVHVREGQAVKRGDSLLTISAERTNAQGPINALLSRESALREKSLDEEIQKTSDLYGQQLESARSRLARLNDERDQLSRSIDIQTERVKLAEAAYESNARLQREQFIAETALQQKRAEVLEQQNRLGELMRAQTSMQRDVLAIESEISTLPLRRDTAIAALERSRSETLAAAAEIETRREELVTAPQDGIATALQVDVGKQVQTGAVLLNLIPNDTRMQAELYVPSRAVGFLKVGAEARLQYQAFAYQKFGAHPGRVVRISKTAVPAQELALPATAGELFYIVTIQPRDDFVLAYGNREPLKPGMQVDADIWLDRRSLLQWMLEPLYTVGGRL